MTQKLKFFAVASKVGGGTQHFSGPHDTRDDANKFLGEVLQEHTDNGVELESAGVFAADYEPRPLPSKAVVADKVK